MLSVDDWASELDAAEAEVVEFLSGSDSEVERSTGVRGGDRTRIRSWPSSGLKIGSIRPVFQAM